MSTLIVVLLEFYVERNTSPSKKYTSCSNLCTVFVVLPVAGTGQQGPLGTLGTECSVFWWIFDQTWLLSLIARSLHWSVDLKFLKFSFKKQAFAVECKLGTGSFVAAILSLCHPPSAAANPDAGCFFSGRVSLFATCLVFQSTRGFEAHTALSIEWNCLPVGASSVAVEKQSSCESVAAVSRRQFGNHPWRRAAIPLHSTNGQLKTIHS